MTSPEGGVFIPNREIYDQLVNANAKLERISLLLEKAQETAQDHEVRIRSNERWKYGMPIAALMALFSLVTSSLTFSGK